MNLEEIEKILGETTKLSWLLATCRELIAEVKNADPYKHLWAVVDQLKLGGGGCPDSLILECVSELREQVVSLQREKAELESKLEAQQKVIDAFGSNVDGVHSLVTEIIEQRSLKLQVAELESRLCGMKELYELHQSNRPDLPFAVRAKIVFRMEEIFQQALSITPTCKHKEEVERWKAMISGAATACIRQQLSSLQAELLEAKKWLFDDNTVALLQAELKAEKEEKEQLRAALDEANNPDFPHPH